jgi:UDP-N-acetyl-D-mannosaminuronate dehydrogenase
MTRRRVVGILGLGYVGLPLALAAVDSGHRVVGYDVDEEHVLRLTTGRSPVEEVSDSELEKALGSGDLRLTAYPEGLGGCDSYVICVPTPLVDRFQLDSVPFRRIEDLSEPLFQSIDLAIIHTDHSAYDWAWIVENSPLVLDTRNATEGLVDPRVERL